jgi:predicted enzyme related to lactoylglutathione lyase
MKAHYIHTNIISNNWKELVKFYEKVFGCVQVLPDRNMSGKWIEDGTGVAHAHIQGVHLRVPGYGDNGPTLEIFQYDENFGGTKPHINQPGYTHIAFRVDDVEAALQEVLSAGGGQLGKLVTKEFPVLGLLTFVYAQDPEGNIIELQNWKKM